ncbi:MAG TPA: hypothetical protein VGJ91_22415 [Polyangiaceae bacterium]|jgi:hypothetical protein
MSGVRHFWCATASLLAQLAFAATGWGSDGTSTVIVSSNTADARMTRALVLIRGELSALGLDVQVRVADATDPTSAGEPTSERLSLDVREGVIVVRVFAAKAEAPLVESVDLDGPEVTPEVIAVRAVEALRAARLLPAQPQRAVAPKPPAEHPPAEHPSAEHLPAEHPPAEHPAAPRVLPIPILQLSLGPTFVQNTQGLPQVSARVAALVGPHWGFAALGAEASLSQPEFEGAAGWAQISRRTLFLQLGARVRVHRAWELNARGGLHYLHYRASGAAHPGYREQDLTHSTGAASLSFGGAYYFVRAFGVYLDLSGLVAFDAARIRLGDENVVSLDRPSLALGVGVLLGAF